MPCGKCQSTVDVHAVDGMACMRRQLANLKARVKEYLDATAALAAADGTHDRPAIARRLADAWLALKG